MAKARPEYLLVKQETTPIANAQFQRSLQEALLLSLLDQNLLTLTQYERCCDLLKNQN